MRTLLVLLTLSVAFSTSTLQAAEPEPGKQVEQEFRTTTGPVPFLLSLPEPYAKSNAWPLMLFLHGRGESFGPLSILKKWGPPRRVENGYPLPYILASPQCPTNESWAQPGQQRKLVELLDHLIVTLKVDTNRIYLAGLSMGGYGSWRLAADHPDRFAAVVPVCGGGKPEDADKLKNLPIWVWHGTEDRAVPLQRSEEMLSALRAAGSQTIRFTVLESIGHNSWEAAFASPDLYDWLDRQTVLQNRGRAEK